MTHCPHLPLTQRISKDADFLTLRFRWFETQGLCLSANGKVIGICAVQNYREYWATRLIFYCHICSILSFLLSSSLVTLLLAILFEPEWQHPDIPNILQPACSSFSTSDKRQSCSELLHQFSQPTYESDSSSLSPQGSFRTRCSKSSDWSIQHHASDSDQRTVRLLMPLVGKWSLPVCD